MKRAFTVGKRRVEYTLISSSRRTNVLLQALPEDKIRVYAPTGSRLRDIDQLVKDRLDWIDEMHAQLNLTREERRLSDMDSILLEGKRVPLVIRPGVANRITMKDGTLIMTTTETTNEARTLQLKRYLYKLALVRIREALDKWSPTVGLPYGRVAIREQRTRWGSCSSKHNLNFNWKLVLAPPEALTYVVIHELCHLKDFNHSPRFWQEVKNRMPEYEVWKKWLKAHGQSLLFP